MEGISKLLFLALLGGIIAYVGDRIGKYVGKKKLTIFNLRPRYTSQIFTVIFGMMISMTTLTILAVISREVRVTLFSVNTLNGQIVQLEGKRKQLQDEIAQLQAQTTLSELVFHINQPIVMSGVAGGQTPEKERGILSALLSHANAVAVERANEAERLARAAPIPVGAHLVLYDKNDLTHDIRFLALHPGNYAAIVYALKNTYLHEKVVVRIDFHENKRIYKAGETILSVAINGGEPQNKILVDLFAALSKLQQAALNAGMIPDPVTNNFGGNILVADLLNKRDQIKTINGPARVNVTANRDLFTIGPLDVSFRVERG